MPKPDPLTTDHGDFDPNVDHHRELLSLLVEAMAAEKQNNIEAHRGYSRVAEALLEALDRTGSQSCAGCAASRRFVGAIIEVSEQYVASLLAE
jgi:hypothetical protein